MHRPACTIASHPNQELRGQVWTVPTTVRQSQQEAALRATLRAQGVADVGWLDAMDGCSHVAHLASPVPVPVPVPARVPRHADELIVPARDRLAREGEGLALRSLCPSVVLGPVWIADRSASMTVFTRLLDGRLPALGLVRM